MNDTLKKHLTNIIEICTDSYKGYETAAKNINESSLQTIFNRLAQQRKLFVEELKNEALIAGFEVNESGSVAGFFHRTWLSTKAAFSFNNIESVIDSSLTGEKEAIEVYNNSIRQDMPSNINEKLIAQLDLIKGAVNQLSSFKSELV